MEAQLSGFTSEYADQVYGRLSFQETGDGRNWYVRGAYSETATDSGASETNVSTMRLDSRIERAQSPDRYTVWTGVLSRRDRDPAGKKESRRSGYHFASYGFGRELDARNKADIGLGLLDIYDSDNGTQPALVCSIRSRRPLGRDLTFDSDILALQPMDRLRSTKLDSEVGLSYAMTDGLSLRLGWSVNNLVKPIRGTKEWDSILRLTISFRRVTTH